ncbi:hypothetical protein F4779DRAFT_573230 [Xylariaceae sp. FL0662B]|nr:hypothetical protein F4779DRAFT_573230 [Xylariaceae sp. FL0662B]
MAEEPTLPRLPAVTSDSETQTFANTRKRARDRVAASPLFSNSSDPAVFSSDDDPNLENYTQGRHRKKRYVGSWYQQQLASSDSTFSDDVQPRPKAKRSFKRQLDSGVWMGSDGSIDPEDDILGDIQLPAETKLPQLRHVLPTTTISPSEADARRIIQDSIDHGIEDIDLSYSGIESLSNATISQLSEFSCIPLVTEDVPFEHKDPSLKIYLANNPLLRAPGALFNLEHLTVLSLRNTKIKELPASIKNLRNLQTLNLSLTQLRYLPGELFDLLEYPSKLESLIIDPNPFFRPGHHKPRAYLRPRPQDADVLHESSFPPVVLQVWLKRKDAPQDNVSYQPVTTSTGLGAARWQTFALARSPVQYRDSRGLIVSKFQLPQPKPTPDSPASGQGLVLPIQTESLSSSPALPSSTRDQVTSSGQKSRVPSLFEVALQACSRTTQLRDLSSYLPPQAPPHFVEALDRVVRQGEENANSGDLPCSVCKRRVIVPMAEWIEWWNIHNTTIPDDGLEEPPGFKIIKEMKVPFLRRGCSWGCLPKPMEYGQPLPGTAVWKFIPTEESGM